MMYYIIYVSDLVLNQPRSTVTDVIKVARKNNAEFGETGILVFDGETFVQYFEGSDAAVRELWANIQADPRHKNVKLLCEGQLHERRFTEFSMGFVDEIHLHDTLREQFDRCDNEQEALGMFLEIASGNVVQ